MRYVFLLIILFVSSLMKANEEQSSSNSVVVVKITDHDGAAGQVFTSFITIGGKQTEKNGVYEHKILHYTDNAYSGKITLQLYEYPYPDGMYLGYCEFSNEEIETGSQKDVSHFTISVNSFSKAEMESSPGVYCVEDQYSLPLEFLKSQQGKIKGTVYVTDGISSTADYSFGVNSESAFISVYAIENFFPHFLGEELTVTFEQKFFPTFGTYSFQSLYILEPPPPLQISVDPIECHGGVSEFIKIDGFPENEIDSVSLRLDITKYELKSSSENPPNIIDFNGENYYWHDQVTSINTFEVKNTSLTINTNTLNDPNFKLNAGLYTIDVFYYKDGKGTLCSSKDTFAITQPDPLELELIVDNYYSSDGEQSFQIPVHGQKVTLDGNISGGNSGGYNLYYSGNGQTGSTFKFNETKFSGNTSYEFWVKDSKNCQSAVVSKTLEQPEELKYEVTPYSPNCNSANTTDTNKTKGKITVKVTEGGIPNFYAACYQNGEEKASISSFSRNKEQTFNLPPGIYTLKVWDNGDPDRKETPVFEKNDTISSREEMTLTASPTDVSCRGGNDGSIALEVSNGTSPFSYTSSDGNSGNFSGTTRSHTINELSSGTYTFTVTDEKECIATEEKSISQPSAALSVLKTDSSPDTCGASDGSLTFEVSGGWTKEGYSVYLEKNNTQIDNQSISEGASNRTVTFTDLEAGTDYTVTVTNGGNCSTTSDETYTVPQSNPLQESLSISLSQKESCDNHKDAIIKVSGMDQIVGDYSCKVADVFKSISSSGEIIGLTANSAATVIITEMYGRQCEFTETINIERIDNPISFNSGSEAEDATCSTASNGSITAIGQGGVGTIQYKLDDGDYGATSVFENKAPGTYTVSIKDDAGCVDDKEFEVGAAPNPIGIGKKLPVNASCETSEDGEIQLRNITHDEGLDMTLTYKLGDVTVSSGEDFSYSGIGPGSYSFTLMDANNCSLTDTIILGDNGYSPVFSPSVIEEVACSGKSNGVVMLTTNNASDRYSYELYTEANLQGDIAASGSASVNTSSLTISGLEHNPRYSAKITDSKGCFGTIDEFEMPILNSSLDITIDNFPASCDEVANGELRITASGGFSFEDSKYKFSYVKGEDEDSLKATDWRVMGLNVGDYLDVQVVDKYGCTESKAVTIGIKENSTRIWDYEKTNPACNGVASGSINLDMKWTPETTDYDFSLFRKDENFNYIDSIAGPLNETNPELTGLLAGNYDLKVTDSDGCTDLWEGIILTDPDSVKVDVQHNYIRVKDESTGEFSIGITGGNNKYEVGWASLPGNSALDNTIITTNSEFSVNALPAGHYMLAVRDTANCTYFEGSSWFTQNIEIVEPEKSLGIGLENLTQVSCNKLADGIIELEAQGGWGPYTYALDGDAEQEEGMFSGLTAGNYTVTVTDTAGVIFNTSYEITEPDTLNIFIDDVRDATCPLYANGRVEATTINGVEAGEGLFYHVENRDDRSVILGELYDDRDYQFYELPKGNYELFVTDANNCVASKIFSLGEPDTARISYQHNYIRAKEAHTGVIASEVTEGNGVYDYQWFFNNEEEPFEQGQTTDSINLSAIPAGIYTLLVRDTARCVYEEEEWMKREIEILEPEMALGFDIPRNRAVSCNGFTDGSLTIEPLGGWGDYRFRLNQNDFVSSPDFENLSAGEYAISVRDSAGIVYTDTVLVTEPDSLKAVVGLVDDVDCFGGEDGFVDLDITGGNLAYYVSVDGINWAEGSRLDSLTTGKYVPQIKDTLNCYLVIDTVFVGQPTEITLADKLITKSRCSNNEGEIIATIEGGTGTFDYSWLKDSMDEDSIITTVAIEDKHEHFIRNIYSGRYEVEVTDEHQCVRNFEFFVGDITDLTIDTIDTRDVSCWGYSDGRASVSTSLGNAPYSYTWSKNVDGISHDSASVIPAGEHEVMVSDAKGCKVTREFTVGTPDSIYYNVVSLEQPLCLGGKKGSIQLQGTGGTPEYSYNWSTGTEIGKVKDLDPGIYQLTITDAHNCVNSFSFDMDYQRNLRPNIGVDTIICHYDVLTLEGGNYHKYSWSKNGKSLSSASSVDINLPGDYYLQVEDEDNCLGFDTLSLEISTLEIRQLDVTDVTCANAADGKAGVDIYSNSDDYSIAWSDGRDGNIFNNVPGGEYQITTSNPLGCEDSRRFTVAEPDPLALTASIAQPLCYGVSDGSIQVSPSGGNGEYQYQWLSGATTSSLRNLTKGSYSLVVADAKNCSISDRYELTFQRALSPDLGSDILLCSQAQTYLSPGVFHTYQWLFNEKEFSTDSLVMVSDPGEYSVVVTDEDNCIAADSLTVKQKQSDLLPEFLMSTSVPMGDTLMIVDVTTPKPEALEWSFTGDYDVVTESDYYCEVIFRNEGIQLVTLNALMDGCMGQIQKQILVTPEAVGRDSEEESTGSSSLIKTMKVSPNPSGGEFRVEVELSKSTHVNLYLVRLNTGQIFEQDRFTGEDSYTKTYNISASGQYVVFAESGGERVMRKVIIY